MSEGLEISGLFVSLGNREVLHDLALRLCAGEYGVVLGPSGSGKSTLLRAVAGLVPARGLIRLGARSLCAGQQVVPAEERRVGLLFQGLALWPHMTVAGHLRYALSGCGVPRAEHGSRIVETLEPLGLQALVDRRPGALSGGERQRLALARALVTQPHCLLLDEPTSSVDPLLKRDVRDLLASVNLRSGTTVLHVTHDQEEALELGGRIFVMDEGRILQAGRADEVYERPASARVASFVGAGGLLPGVIGSDGTADTPLGTLMVDDAGLRGPVWLHLRPEHLAPAPEGEGIPVRLVRVAYQGGTFRACVSVAERALWVDLPERPPDGGTLRIRVVRPPRAVEARRNS